MRSSTLYRHAGGLPGSHPWFLIFRENSWDFLLIYCRASVWHMACFVFYNTENSLLGFVFPFQLSVFAHCNITRNTNNRDEQGNTKTGINFPSDKQKTWQLFNILYSALIGWCIATSVSIVTWRQQFGYAQEMISRPKICWGHSDNNNNKRGGRGKKHFVCKNLQVWHTAGTQPHTVVWAHTEPHKK